MGRPVPGRSFADGFRARPSDDNTDVRLEPATGDTEFRPRTVEDAPVKEVNGGGAGVGGRNTMCATPAAATGGTAMKSSYDGITLGSMKSAAVGYAKRLSNATLRSPWYLHCAGPALVTAPPLTFTPLDISCGLLSLLQLSSCTLPLVQLLSLGAGSREGALRSAVATERARSSRLGNDGRRKTMTSSSMTYTLKKTSPWSRYSYGV